MMLVYILTGMTIGNILNLVATYLPRRMQENLECQYDFSWKLRKEQKNESLIFEKIKLFQCQNCEQSLSFFIIFPFFRSVCLGGKCKTCENFFGIRYWIVEIIVGLISAAIIIFFVVTWKVLFFLIFAWMLILLAIIDSEYYLLPDIIVYPVLWIGLFANTFYLIVPLEEAVLGAIYGYLILFCIAKIFKYIRGIEGLGLGDCKLFALLGAWCGAEALLHILLISSAIGSAINLPKLFLKKSDNDRYIPFGPYLVLGGLLTIFL